MRLRAEVDAEAVATFLDNQQFPHPWSKTKLDREAVKARIETDDGNLVGYVWGVWERLLPSTMDFHACVKQEFRGRWLTKDMVRDLEFLAGFFGAKALMAHVASDREGRLIEQLFVRRFGYTRVQPGVIYRRIS